MKKISPRQTDIFSRLHIALTALTLVLGTVVTGAGPHAGDIDSPRLQIPVQTATLMHGLAVVLLLIVTLAFFLGRETPDLTRRRLIIFAVLSLAQGVIGFIQYIQGVPQLLVAVHLAGSILVWIGAWRIWLSVQREEMVELK